MTQFMLCIPDTIDAQDVELQPIAGREALLSDAARSLYGSEANVRVPWLRGARGIDEIFTEAHNAVANGRDFATTRLAAFLPGMMHGCRSFALWWGDDWSDLPVVGDESALLSELVDQLREPPGEVYLRWQRPERKEA